MTPAEALQRLQDGNRRFVEGCSKHDHTSREWRHGLVAGQTPFAVVVGCSDSRVPTELVFDLGFGDLFVIRNIGNVIRTDVLASVGFAIVHLGTRLILVMGHEQCGAVTAAVQSNGTAEPTEVREILDHIRNGLAGADLPADPAERISKAVEANVRRSVQQLENLADGWDRPVEGIVFVGAIYDLDSGRVRFLNEARK
jgi:carbonic anhydrase